MEMEAEGLYGLWASVEYIRMPGRGDDSGWRGEPGGEVRAMIDYSEGCTDLKRMVDDLWKAMIDNRYAEAKELCNEIVVMARLTRAQIERWRHALHMQVERQRGGNPGGERRTGE